MNLYDMYYRKDRALVSNPNVELAVEKNWVGGNWAKLVVPASAEPQFVIPSVLSYYPMSMKPQLVGWNAAAPGGKGFLTTSLVENELVISRHVMELGPEPRPVLIPWPLRTIDMHPGTTLTLHFDLTPEQSGSLLVFRYLERKALLKLAKGNGVEIGPGMNPRIHPSDDVSVTYLEQMSEENWRKLYDRKEIHKDKRELWKLYKLGHAADLPFADRSLDFIFSSHVFEHLSNPLGHLRHWHSKLRDGGLVLAVVPSMCGTKDCRLMPSTLEEAIGEHEAKTWVPTLAHYQRFAASRNRENDIDAMMRDNESIHVHFYCKENIVTLLKYCVEYIGFSGWDIQYSQNHKDFYFVLRVSA